MRHLELVTVVVAGLFVRPEQHAELNRRLEHALDMPGDPKRPPSHPVSGRKSKLRPI